MTSNEVHLYFTDVFRVCEQDLDDYGAFNISLITDLPLFIDPFLLFNSDRDEYQELHLSIIKYMKFLKDIALNQSVPQPLLKQWFSFPEVAQNWLGFSQYGNRGRGLGMRFVTTLHRNFTALFADFGEEIVSRSSHIEKLCLVRDGVGRDMLSDFTANLVKGFLCRYTQQFASKYVSPSDRKWFSVRHVDFNYRTRSWVTRQYELPLFGDDYVLLSPKNILTRDDAWINRADLTRRFRGIADALPNSALRAQVNDYLESVLGDGPHKQDEIEVAVSGAIRRFPEVLDHYIRVKEDDGDRASSIASSRVNTVHQLLVRQVGEFVEEYLRHTGFYRIGRRTYADARSRLLFLKDVIENKGGHRLFYLDGKPIMREDDLQILYRLTWFASAADPSREVNDGRGPADYKISMGSADKTLVEFKLAKNHQLKRNLAKQSEIYERASNATEPSLKAVIFFSDQEKCKVESILDELNLDGSPHVVLIDARSGNKPSGSKA